MSKWEYIFVSQYTSYVHEVNGNVHEDWKDKGRTGLNIYTYFDQIGEDGWELVLHAYDQYVFKRPIEE